MDPLNWRKYEVVTTRRQIEPDAPEVAIERPGAAVAYFQAVADLDMGESLFAGYVDGRNRLIGFEQIYRGTATGLSINLYEIVRSVISSAAAGFFLVHNHPSGDPEPSDEDTRITRDLLKVCNDLDMVFLDHLVIGRDRWVSIRSVKPNMWAEGDPE